MAAPSASHTVPDGCGCLRLGRVTTTNPAMRTFALPLFAGALLASEPAFAQHTPEYHAYNDKN